MSKASEGVKKWRANTKRKLVIALGGKCVICGYIGHNEVFDLHHLDPEKKDFAFGQIIANPTAWEKLIVEAKKCVLLCANCHRLYHAGRVQLPDTLPEFDESLILVEDFVLTKKCAVCKILIPDARVTCSRKCAAVKRFAADWNSIDLKSMLLAANYNYAKVGQQLDLSGAAIAKRAKKLGIYKSHFIHH